MGTNVTGKGSGVCLCVCVCILVVCVDGVHACEECVCVYVCTLAHYITTVLLPYTTNWALETESHLP